MAEELNHIGAENASIPFLYPIPGSQSCFSLGKSISHPLPLVHSGKEGYEIIISAFCDQNSNSVISRWQPYQFQQQMTALGWLNTPSHMHLNNGRADKKRNGIHSHISLTNSPNQIGLEVQSLNLQETDGALLLDRFHGFTAHQFRYS